jgi:hypothetical protein
MNFFDFDFDFQDCLGAVLAGIFLLGSVQLHAVFDDQASESKARLVQAQEISPAPAVARAVHVGTRARQLGFEDYPGEGS